MLAFVSIPVLLAATNLGNQFISKLGAKNKIISARQTAEKSADSKANGAVNDLRRLGVVASSIESSKVDVCYVTHRDAGWVASGWYQDCYLRYVSGFVTAMSREELRSSVMANPSTLLYFGEEYSSSYCGLFGQNYEATLIFRPANITNEEYDCNVPRLLQGLWSVRGPATHDDELSVKTYKTFDPETVPNSQNQVWFVFDERYYHEELGCGLGPIFCSNPRNKPVHPSV